MYTIAITGGIGAGKSVVSAILSAMGFCVYDSDSQAKRLMDASPMIKQSIADEISADALMPDGTINRQELSRIVFADKEALGRLNRIVHQAVREHFSRWRSSAGDVAFIETAIPYQSGISDMVDEIWEVTAPTSIRIQRVMARNHMTAQQVQARIEAQAHIPHKPHPHVTDIANSPSSPLLPQILKQLDLLGKRPSE